MFRIVFVLAIATLKCSGFHDASYRSSIMYGEKPILRLGPDEPENAEDEQLKEPEWVTNLRSNIKHQIGRVGLENAKPDIKDLIEEANAQVNADHEDDDGYHIPEVRVPVKVPLRSGSNNPCKLWKKMCRKCTKCTFCQIIKLNSGQNIESRLPEWETDLKSYIKDLIGTYGKENLDNYVRPVVNSIEKAQRILIKDIDGEVFVNYVRNANPGIPDPYQFKPHKRPGRMSPRFTMSP